MRNQWPVLPLVAGLASGLLTGCGTENGDSGGTGSAVVMGMSDDVLATDPASGYDPGSWLLFNNVFQSLLSFPEGATEPQPVSRPAPRPATMGRTRHWMRLFTCECLVVDSCGIPGPVRRARGDGGVAAGQPSTPRPSSHSCSVDEELSA